LTADEIKKLTAQVEAKTTRAFDQKLAEQLEKLAGDEQQRVDNKVAENKGGETILKTLRSSREQNTAALCAILKQYGWPTRDLAGENGARDAFFLLRNNANAQFQRDLLPVMIALGKAGEISKAAFATYIDRLRINAGLKQIFGTQATIQNGFLVLFPIVDEKHVDARRKQYELPPLQSHLRGLEYQYRLPLIKATGPLANSFADSPTTGVAEATNKAVQPKTDSDVDVVSVDTNLVNLNVSVYGAKLRTEVQSLAQKDFQIKEDGQPQEITFFAATDAPFDLVLLLDLSGSTAGKRDLIRKSAKRFIEAARPSDRIAIVTFADEAHTICPLTNDHWKLLAGAAQIDGDGGSHVWEALAFTLDHVFESAGAPRRHAVVFMTDGVDNAFASSTMGSKISFSDLLESVRKHDALIVPIYLDTEGRDSLAHRIYENARNTLSLLADESGGLYYKAKKIDDLNGVYEQVIQDLGQVYSLGYRSTNQKRDGSYRMVNIELSAHPELKTRARPGYYAN